MRKNCHKLLPGVIAIIALFFIFCPLTAKASYNNSMYVIDSTDTTITIDWEEAAQDKINEYMEEGEYTSVKFKSFKLGYAKCPVDTATMNDVRNNATINIDTSKRQYTITGLEPDSTYFISVAWETQMSGPGVSGSGYHNFQLNSACTTKDGKTAKLLGTTGTTATVDLREALNEIDLDYVAEGHRTGNFSISVGYAEQTGTEEAAKLAARKMAGRRSYCLGSNQGTYQMRGLKTGKKYSFCAYVTFSYYEGNKSNYATRYIELSGITPSGDNDAEAYPYEHEDGRYDRSTDDVTRGLTSFYHSFNCPSFKLTPTENSITVDWTDQYDVSTVVRGAKGETKICITYIKNEEYDPVKDRAQFGADTRGYNAREAMKKIQSSRIEVPVTETSYTITGLEPATSYTVILKCSYTQTNLRCDRAYFYDSNICTKGSPTTSEYEDTVRKNIQKAYMFDNVDFKRESSGAALNWTAALNSFCGQTALEKHFAQLSKGSTCRIGFAKLPDTPTRESVEKAYAKAYGNARNSNYTAYGVEYPYKKCKLYEMDPDAKYVVAIYFTAEWYHFGRSNSINDTFYFDETGINYYKAKATKTEYNGISFAGSGDQPGSGSSGSGGSGSSGSGGSGSSGSGGSGSSGNGGSGSSGNGGSGSSGNSGTGSSSSNRPTWNTDSTGTEGYVPATTQVGSDTASKDETSFKYLGKKKADHAWISYDSKKISASKLAKKAQTITLKVENSTGKIKVKNTSGSKADGCTKVKVKGRKIVLTFKKGSPKGTYKFDVTVGANKGIKKTRETVKIRIK